MSPSFMFETHSTHIFSVAQICGQSQIEIQRNSNFSNPLKTHRRSPRLVLAFRAAVSQPYDTLCTSAPVLSIPVCILVVYTLHITQWDKTFSVYMCNCLFSLAAVKGLRGHQHKHNRLPCRLELCIHTLMHITLCRSIELLFDNKRQPKRRNYGSLLWNVESLYSP